MTSCKIAKFVCATFVAISFGAVAAPTPSQHQLILDDLPVGYASALEAVTNIPKSKEMKPPEQVAPGMFSYITGSRGEIKWWIFTSGHEFYPSAVRRRVVDTGHGFTVRTSILCGASKVECQKLKDVLSAMDSSY